MVSTIVCASTYFLYQAQKKEKTAQILFIFRSIGNIIEEGEKLIQLIYFKTKQKGRTLCSNRKGGLYDTYSQGFFKR